MRKSVFILLTVFTACLLCKESENMPGTSRKFMDETFLNRGEENLLARQWQCEYIYSDLSFTSVLPEAKKTRSTVSMFRHGAHRRLRATVYQCVASHTGFRASQDSQQGYTEKVSWPATCRRLLRLSPAPAHYLAIWQEDSQRPGKNMECPENGKVVCPVFGGIKCPAVSRSKFVFYTCRPDAYTINIAPDGSVLSENPKDGDLRCTDMLTRSVVHDGIFYVLKRAVVISHNGLYG